mmetsp:Transcript_10215/g.24069  ORF Transcript_10215/g.24069 Transcript_10215/m.24069 type:complete len:255 (-) Transcript_10215:603-1367(-)
MPARSESCPAACRGPRCPRQPATPVWHDCWNQLQQLVRCQHRPRSLWPATGRSVASCCQQKQQGFWPSPGGAPSRPMRSSQPLACVSPGANLRRPSPMLLSTLHSHRRSPQALLLRVPHPRSPSLLACPGPPLLGRHTAAGQHLPELSQADHEHGLHPRDTARRCMQAALGPALGAQLQAAIFASAAAMQATQAARRHPHLRDAATSAQQPQDLQCTWPVSGTARNAGPPPWRPPTSPSSNATPAARPSSFHPA